MAGDLQFNTVVAAVMGTGTNTIAKTPDSDALTGLWFTKPGSTAS